MPPVVSLLMLAFAVSLDGFGVGVMYGLRKIKIPLSSVAIISSFSGLVILIAMRIGVWIASFFSPVTAKHMGAVILIGIGVWAVYQMMTQQDDGGLQDGDLHEGIMRQENTLTASGTEIAGALAGSGLKSAAETLRKTVVSIELKRIGVVIQILRTPSIADADRSGVISASEAALLGLSLSLDAFGAGIGAALIGFTPAMTAAVIAASSGVFIAAGLRAGFRFADMRWIRRFSVMPGCLLILMGILKLL